MDRQSSTTRSDLERMLIDETAEPKALPLSLLGEITDGFSDEREIGDGGFATVYMGMLGNGMVAVKRLSNTHMHEKEFHREVECLMMVRHKNVVRFLGYCADTQGSMERYNGKLVMADVQERLLCFEYVPKGSLHEYISDPSRGLDWRNRYRIIKGIVEGLHYLHIKNIVHLDLKPSNILLDHNMVPKIADFGLSRCFDEQQSQLIATKIGGTFGYVAPEFGNGVITRRFDLYSLGVIIIEILTGEKGYHAVENVLESWREKLEISSGDTQFDQVSVCAQIGIECTENNPSKRPFTQQIIDRLEKTENMDGSMETIGWTRSSTLQEETASCELHHGTLTVIQETSTEDSSLSWSSYRTKSGEIHDAAIPIQLALTKINSFSQHHIHMDKNGDLPEKIEQIAMELTVMENVIHEIGAAHLTNKVVNNWVGEVSKLAYHVEDVMDKYSYHNLQQDDRFFMKFLMKGARNTIVFNEIVIEVDEILKEIDHVTKMKQMWLDPSELVPNKHSDIERQWSQIPELVKDEDLVGVEGSRLNLTGWLYSELDEQDSTLITVSGMGGLGKTTLVTNVYQREKIRFSVHAWIIVSQTYNVEDLLKKLLRKIGYTEQAQLAHMDAHDLKEKVKEKLKGKKCLIVLDDVWDREAYTKIQEAFHDLQESRIIITTRKKHVATLAPPTRQLELQPLGEVDAFNLFSRRAFYNRKKNKCPSELEKLAKSITDRCQGLPLAIVSIGSMMSSKQLTEHAWEMVSNQLRSELTKNDNVKAILNLSYYDLPGDLRNCFLYCSLFPEDYLMPRESLVRLWVAEGFADSRENNTPEDVAEENLMELIHRNMLEVVENDELGRVSTCKMHDIVRDLALSVARDEKFGSANDSGTIMKMDNEVRRLSTYKWEDKSKSKVPFLHLRTIISLATISSPNGMLSSILSESTYLTVLELQDSDITEVPPSIGALFNLRYIGLRRTRIKSIPDSIEKLPNLTTLDIKQTKIEKLPRGISKVKKLRHLLADRFADEKQSEFRYFIGVQPPKELSQLEELQTLETVAASADLAKQLEKLTKLQSVWIDNITGADCAHLFATLSNMPLLSSLLLSASDENETLFFETLKPTSTRLHRLIVRGRWAQGTVECPIFLEHGKNLKYLALSWCQFVEDPLLQLASHVQNLTYLSLNRVNCADTLVLYAGCFPKLKILVLKNMPDVNKIQIEDSALPSIEGLYIVSMWKLDKVPEGIEYLRSLKKLWLLRLHMNFKTHWDKNEMHKKMQYIPELKI